MSSEPSAEEAKVPIRRRKEKRLPKRKKKDKAHKDVIPSPWMMRFRVEQALFSRRTEQAWLGSTGLKVIGLDPSAGEPEKKSLTVRICGRQ